MKVRQQYDDVIFVNTSLETVCFQCVWAGSVSSRGSLFSVIEPARDNFPIPHYDGGHRDPTRIQNVNGVLTFFNVSRIISDGKSSPASEVTVICQVTILDPELRAIIRSSGMFNLLFHGLANVSMHDAHHPLLFLVAHLHPVIQNSTVIVVNETDSVFVNCTDDNHTGLKKASPATDFIDSNLNVASVNNSLSFPRISRNDAGVYYCRTHFADGDVLFSEPVNITVQCKFQLLSQNDNNYNK